MGQSDKRRQQLTLPLLGDFQELHFTKDIVEAGLAGDTNLYYMALVERGTGNHSADSGSR